MPCATREIGAPEGLVARCKHPVTRLDPGLPAGMQTSRGSAGGRRQRARHRLGLLEKLFERYFRLEADRSRRAGGVGLGLPIARALARAMGGELTVYSHPERGCAFLVRLLLGRQAID